MINGVSSMGKTPEIVFFRQKLFSTSSDELEGAKQVRIHKAATKDTAFFWLMWVARTFSLSPTNPTPF